MATPDYGLGPGTGFTGTTPLGWTCATVRDFVVVGSLTTDRYAIQWCAIGDPTDWPTPNTDDARSKQSGRQEFTNKFGVITGIVGNDFYGYVFQERAITKMTYVGGDVVFSFDTFEESRGAKDYGRIATVDDLSFFQSQYGFHALENDQVIDIGYGIVDDTYGG